jgi:hypothetical protein
MTNAGVSFPPRAVVRSLRDPLWGRWSTPLGRLSPVAFGRSAAAEARRERKRVERAENPRVTRRQRLADMRMANLEPGQPVATRADVTAVLRQRARARRAGLL